MYVVCVTFEIASGKMVDFMPIMRKQAANSVELESGCHQFDVCTDPEHPNEVFLYELYDDRAAFDAHLESEHFRSFDAIVSKMVLSKSVRTWAEQCQGT